MSEYKRFAQVAATTVPDQIGQPTLVILALTKRGELFKKVGTDGLWEKIDGVPAERSDHAADVFRAKPTVKNPPEQEENDDAAAE